MFTEDQGQEIDVTGAEGVLVWLSFCNFATEFASGHLVVRVALSAARWYAQEGLQIYLGLVGLGEQGRSTWRSPLSVLLLFFRRFAISPPPGDNQEPPACFPAYNI